MLTAGEIMTSAAQLMAERHIHRVVIVDELGRLRGIVTTMDIVKTVARGLRIDL